MDTGTFSREATIRICGKLEFEEALHDSLLYLRQVMPVDKLFLQFFDAELKAFRTIAIVTPEQGKEVDQVVPLSPEALRELAGYEELFRRGQGGSIAWLFRGGLYDQAVIRDYFPFHKTEITSLLVMPLGLEEQMLGRGSMFLVTEGEEKFTQEQADLLTLLKEAFTIAMSNALRHREVLRLRDRLADDNRYLRRELFRISGDEIVGADFGLREVMRMVHQVAPTESAVLLAGETGVGKDVVANAVHYASPRREGPFIAVNCGAIPETLLDSELFGHEKGAFTGALSRKRGRFERAHQGTIFLDEIGEMPLNAQVRLLRVLQNREIERIGGTERVPVDIRVIAATNSDLEPMVRSGRFREDLWFRLNVFPIVIPPLRERTTDLPALVQHFLERKARELKLEGRPELAPGAIDELLAYSWPGNVRELENLVERAMILYRDEPLRFSLGVSEGGRQRSAVPESVEGKFLNLDEAFERQIRRVLEMTGGKIHGPGGAGELLGVNPNTLRSKMRKLGIPHGRHLKKQGQD